MRKASGREIENKNQGQCEQTKILKLSYTIVGKDRNDIQKLGMIHC